jgi:hypothetical protein
VLSSREYVITVFPLFFVVIPRRLGETLECNALYGSYSGCFRDLAMNAFYLYIRGVDQIGIVEYVPMPL